MNKRHLVYKILLSLLLTSSYVILSGHVASHVNSDATACVLCISHGSAASAIPVAGTLIDISLTVARPFKTLDSTRLKMGFIVHNPARAPPIPR